MRSPHWRTAALSIAVAALTVCPLQAQVRPAATKNVDEPGRTPWQVMFSAARSQTGCGLNFCNFMTPSIPAGKRLVLTNVAVTVNLDATAVLQAFRVVVTDGANALITLYLPLRTPFPPDSISIGNPRRNVSNETVRIYVEPGQRLLVDFHTADGSLAADWHNMVLLTGYLVDLSV